MGKSIYLVLDMENDLVHADGVNGKAAYGIQVRERNILVNTRTALAKARESHKLVGFERVGLLMLGVEFQPAAGLEQARDLAEPAGELEIAGRAVHDRGAAGGHGAVHGVGR